jgi:hypothetical protein
MKKASPDAVASKGQPAIHTILLDVVIWELRRASFQRVQPHGSIAAVAIFAQAKLSRNFNITLQD